MTRVTVETITRAAIEALREEAKKRGDAWQIVICDAALAGDAKALAECVTAINVARARSD